jgi:TonB family protein
MRQLQAWWDVHAYYPKHASNNDEGGTVKIHLQIHPDGSIFSVALAESSGSKTLDAAGLSAFRTGAVRPFPEGEPAAELDLSLNYVLAHRHNEVLTAGYTPTPDRGPFTIANDPVKSQILETMLQKTCTGTVTRNGGMGQPWRGMRAPAEVVFFRRPDGTPWVRFAEAAMPVSVSPVVEIGNMLQFVGPTFKTAGSYGVIWTLWTVWPDGPNHMSGGEGSPIPNHLGAVPVYGLGGPVDLTCSTDILPTVPYNNVVLQTMATTPGDPP